MATRKLTAVKTPVELSKVYLDDAGNVLTPIAELSGVAGDESSFNPREFSTALQSFASVLPEWDSARSAYSQATETVAKREMVIRACFVRPDEAIDWAGQLGAYRQGYAYVKSEYKLSGIDADACQKACGVWRSRNNYAVQAVAMHCCEQDPKLAAMTVTVGVGKASHPMTYAELSENPPDGFKIPAKLYQAITKQYEAQNSPTTGIRYKGWEVAPSAFGPKGKKSDSGGSGGGSGKTTPAKAWGLIRANVSNLAPLDTVAETIMIVTKLSDHLIGAPDEKATIEDGLIPDRGAVVNGLRTLAMFADTLSNYIDENGQGSTQKEKVTRYRAEVAAK